MLDQAGLHADYAAVEAQVARGVPLEQALAASPRLKTELDALRKRRGKAFYTASDAQLQHLALQRLGQLGALSLHNLRAQLKAADHPEAPSLVELYFPRVGAFDLPDGADRGAEPAQSPQALGLDRLEFANAQGQPTPARRFLAGQDELGQPQSDTERRFAAVVGAKRRRKRAKQFLWELGRHFFEPEKVLSIGAREGHAAARQAVVEQMLRFFSDHDVAELSTDFERDVLGLRTRQPELRAQLAAAYDAAVQVSAAKTLQFVEGDQPVLDARDYEQLQQKLSAAIALYARQRSLDDQLELRRDRERAVSLQELLGDEDQAALDELGELLAGRSGEGGLQAPAPPSLESKLASLLDRALSSPTLTKAASAAVKKELLDLHATARDLDHFRARLRGEKALRDPRVRALADRVLAEGASAREARLALDSQASLDMLASLKSLLEAEVDALLANLRKLRRYQRGLMDPHEERALLSAADKAVQAELVEVYGSPLNPLDPGPGGLAQARPRASTADAEDQELAMILDGAPGAPRKRAHVLDLAVRPDVRLRPRVVVADRPKYLSRLEAWKHGMQASGLAALVPDIDLESSVVEAPGADTGVRAGVFNLPEFFDNDPWQPAETTGIAAACRSLQARVDRLERRARFEEALRAELERLVQGHDLNLFVCLHHLYCRAKADEARLQAAAECARPKQSPETQLAVELDELQRLLDAPRNAPDEAPHEAPHQAPHQAQGFETSAQATQLLLRAVVRKSLRATALRADDADAESLANAEAQVQALVQGYTQLLEHYLEDAAVWSDGVQKPQRVLDVLGAFESELESREEAAFTREFVQGLRAHLELDQRQRGGAEEPDGDCTEDLLRGDDSRQAPRPDGHFASVMQLLDDRLAVAGDGLEQVEFHVGSETLDDHEALERHFERLFWGSARVPTEQTTADNVRRFARLVPQGVGPRAAQSALDFRKHVLAHKLAQLRQERQWLGQYMTHAQRERGLELGFGASAQNRLVPEAASNSQLMAGLLEAGPPVPDWYQEDLRSGGFMDSDPPDQEHLAAPGKAWTKNARAVAAALQAKLRFSLDAERLVLEAVQTARAGEDGLLAEAIRYITESTRARGEGKNSFWEAAAGHSEAQPHPPSGDGTGTRSQAMTVQGVYSGLVLKKKLKHFLLQALREKATERVLVEGKSAVQADFMRFVLENFHGSGAQRRALAEWLREVPDFDGFYAKLQTEYDDSMGNDLVRQAWDKTPRMTADEVKAYDHRKVLGEPAAPSNAIQRDVLGAQVLEAVEADYHNELHDRVMAHEQAYQNWEEADENLLQAIGDKIEETEAKIESGADFDEQQDTAAFEALSKESYESTFDLALEKPPSPFKPPLMGRERPGKTEMYQHIPRAAELQSLVDVDEQRLSLEPWPEPASLTATPAQKARLAELDERLEALESAVPEPPEEGLRVQLFDQAELDRIRQAERRVLGDEPAAPPSRQDMVAAELEALEAFKSDLLGYLAGRVADHRAELQSRAEAGGEMPQAERIQRALGNRADKLVATFYDNRALDEFNTLRRLRELAEQSRKFEFEDVGRAAHAKARDRLLERARPELVSGEVGRPLYPARRPRGADAEGQGVRRYLEPGPEDAHEVDEPVLDSDGEEVHSDDEFLDQRNYEYRVHGAKKADLADLDQLRPMVFGDLYAERPVAHVATAEAPDRAREWFTQKYEFALDPAQLSEREALELNMIAYLFYLNKARKLTLGDVFLEMSRRRLDLDPRKFRGAGLERLQQYRVQLRRSFAGARAGGGLKAAQRQFRELFPPDKITDFELLADEEYFRMVDSLTRLRARESPSFVFEDDSFQAVLDSDPAPPPDPAVQRLQVQVLDGAGTGVAVRQNELHVQPDLPPVCLELELFNLVDLYFAMYPRQPHAPAPRGPARKQDVARILARTRPVLKLDEQVSFAFSASLHIERDPVSGEPLLDFAEICRQVDVDERLAQMAFSGGESPGGEADLEALVERLVEEVVRVCPHVYPESFGADPGREDPAASIQSQILRRFEDHVARESPVRTWRRSVELEFAPDAPALFDEDALRDPRRRPDHLNKADYDDAVEAQNRGRAAQVFNAMRSDAFFEAKAQEYFSTAHRARVRNAYQRSFGFLERPQEALDRATSPLVRNELVDFLLRYSDIRMQTRARLYSSYAGRDLVERQAAQERRSELVHSPLAAEHLDDRAPEDKAGFFLAVQRVRDFERRFVEASRPGTGALEPELPKSVTPSVCGDLVDLEARLNRLRDKAEFAGMHGIYREHTRDSTAIPFALPQLDVRCGADEWVAAQVEAFLDEAMRTRLDLERYLGADELRKFDAELRRLLTRGHLREAVLGRLDQELTAAELLRRNYVKRQDVAAQTSVEAARWDDTSSATRKSLKNPEALKLLYAHDSQRAKRSQLDLRKNPVEHSEHLDTVDMLTEEAAGANYDFLLWQRKKRDFLRSGAGAAEYMEREGFRSRRFLGNEFMARHFGKTVFPEHNQHDVYAHMGLSVEGSDGLFAEPHVSQDSLDLQKLHSASPDQDIQVLHSAVAGLGGPGRENQASKRLGWYFGKVNREMQARL